MPLIETKGAASAQGFGLTIGGDFGPFYIEDVFSTFLYSGNGTSKTITNGINLAGKGGLVWIKGQDGSKAPQLFDTNRGIYKRLSTAGTNAEYSSSDLLTAFNNNGFSVGSNSIVNNSTMTSWTFRKQPKFFDVVTYTGNGTTGRNISHNLGSTPGCIIVRRYDTIAGWDVYHRSFGATKAINLHATGGSFNDTIWNNTSPTSAVFTVNGSANTNGGTYVAYLFAHDAGGFGLNGTDSVISCGSYLGNSFSGTSGPIVTLGWEPQWVMIKRNSTSNWQIIDNRRGMIVGGSDRTTQANLNNDDSTLDGISPTATGFQVTGSSTEFNSDATTYIYIAIRRGPMKTPTSGTSVFSLNAYTGSTFADTFALDSGFVSDVYSIKRRTGGTSGWKWMQRLVSYPGFPAANYANPTALDSTSTSSESSSDTWGLGINPDELNNTDYFRIRQDGSGNWNLTGSTYVNYAFKRAPGFFDVVCYKGTGSATTFNHNLGVAPELVIVKWRAGATGENWAVMCTAASSSPDRRFLYLDLNAAGGGLNGKFADSSGTPVLPTATQVYIGTNDIVNKSAATYVAYLFATCAGVSKVGSYTGSGTTKQIDCGFTGGARFVLIKRTDSTGDWYVWDSTRGIVAGNDPYLLLNSTAAEVTSTDYIDTYSAGFEISSTAPAAINANGGTFIFLAIA